VYISRVEEWEQGWRVSEWYSISFPMKRKKVQTKLHSWSIRGERRTGILKRNWRLWLHEHTLDNIAFFCFIDVHILWHDFRLESSLTSATGQKLSILSTSAILYLCKISQRLLFNLIWPQVYNCVHSLRKWTCNCGIYLWSHTQYRFKNHDFTEYYIS